MRVALADALRALLPSREQTLFLQACLARGDAVSTAWREWARAVEDPLRFLAGEGRELRGHLPLLYGNLADNGIPVPPDLGPYLRAAVLRAKLRREKYESCLADALDALNRAPVDLTLLRGSALGAATRHELPPRHCHDIDAWLPAADHATAVKALAARGYAVRWLQGGSTRIDHPMGLPIVLHTDLLPWPYRLCVEEARRRRREHRTPMGAFQVLCPPDMLAHVCGHAATRRRRPHANWVVDATRLAWAMAPPDWETFLEVAGRAGIALPTLVLLAYLRDGYAAPIPAPVMDGLAHAAGGADRVQRMAAIDGARLGDPGGLASLLRHGGWRSRAIVAATLAFPPARYLRAARGDLPRPKLLAEYAARPARLALRQLRRLRRHGGPGRTDGASGGAETIRPPVRGHDAWVS